MKWLYLASVGHRRQGTFVTAGIYLLMLTILYSFSNAEAKKCTTKVKIEKPSTKVPRTKRIPAKCSNWDRSWSWITKMDCGTKYVLDYVDLPKHQQYRIDYICCPGELDCKSAALEESDERFLAITFGCASAALTILIIIIIISVCRRKHHGFAFCKFGHQYETTSDQDITAGCNADRICQNEYVCDDLKLVESEYEEICDIHSSEWSSAKEKLIWEDKPSSSELNQDTDMQKEAAVTNGVLQLLDLEENESDEASHNDLDTHNDIDNSLIDPKDKISNEENEQIINTEIETDCDPTNKTVIESRNILELSDSNLSNSNTELVKDFEEEEVPVSSFVCEEKYKDIDVVVQREEKEKEHSYEKINTVLQQSDDERYETLKQCSESDHNGYSNVA